MRRTTGGRLTTRIRSRRVNEAADDEKYVYFLLDVETSGLDAVKESVVEIAVVEYKRDTPIASYAPCSVLVKPGFRLSSSNVRIHGITNGMLDADGVSFNEAWNTVSEYITSRVQRGEEAVIVAHNVTFDAKFVQAELERANLEHPPWKWTCSLALARALGHSSCRLGVLANLAGVNEDDFNAHRAGGDVAALAKVLDHFHSTSGDVLRKLRERSFVLPFVSRITRAKRDATSGSRVRKETAPASAPLRVAVRSTSGAASGLASTSPRSVRVSFDESPVEFEENGAVLLHTPYGKRFHTKRDCDGLAKAKSILSCSATELPSSLTPCRLCAGGVTGTRTALEDNSPTGAKYYKAPTGKKYHISRDCRGLSKAKTKIACAQLPTSLEACKLCVGVTN